MHANKAKKRQNSFEFIHHVKIVFEIWSFAVTSNSFVLEEFSLCSVCNFLPHFNLKKTLTGLFISIYSIVRCILTCFGIYFPFSRKILLLIKAWLEDKKEELNEISEAYHQRKVASFITESQFSCHLTGQLELYYVLCLNRKAKWSWVAHLSYHKRHVSKGCWLKYNIRYKKLNKKGQ